MQVPYRKPGKYSQIKNDPFLTPDKYTELEKKLEKLKKTQPSAAHEVSRLAELGDFSENVEYQLAKGRLRGINNAILLIERQLVQAEIITPQKQTNSIQIGHQVTLESNNKVYIYQILGSSETNPVKGIISHNSPIGQGLIGRKVGDLVKIKLANKEVVYKVLKIES